MAIFRIKNSDISHITAQNIDCGYSLEPPRRGGSNEYPHSMFLSRNKKNNVYPCKPQFYYIKVGFKGVKLYRHVFVMAVLQISDVDIIFIMKTYLYNVDPLKTHFYTIKLGLQVYTLFSYLCLKQIVGTC